MFVIRAKKITISDQNEILKYIFENTDFFLHRAHKMSFCSEALHEYWKLVYVFSHFFKNVLVLHFFFENSGSMWARESNASPYTPIFVVITSYIMR